ncbi:MAG TPA: hypothetical protein VIH30_09950, partial [Aquirhabdus sp.]
ELVQANGQPYPAYESRGRFIAQFAMSKGILLRPIGHNVYIIPPYCITAEEIEQVIDIARQAIEWAVMQPIELNLKNITENISLP